MSIPDGSGGAIVVWEDESYGDVYAQHISASGVALFGTGGVKVCSAESDQTNGTVVLDGSGGFIVVWNDLRTDPRDIYAQRFDALGNALWATDGVPVCVFTGNQSGPHAVSDGSGGVIVTWSDTRAGAADIYMQRIDDAGAAQWTPNGVALCTAPNTQAAESILRTDTGNVVVVWFDRRSSAEDDIYAQRINLAGAAEWTPNGVSICVAVGRQRNPAVVSDGADGAIIAWDDRRNDTDEDVYAQRVDASGVVAWTPDGVEACGAAGRQLDVKAVSDGAGGSIIAWTDFRSDGDIFAQRVDASGLVHWTNDGVRVTPEFATQFLCEIVTDGAGGAIVAWNDQSNGNDVYAQRLDMTGTAQWEQDGVAVANGSWDEMDITVASNQSGGAIVSWVDRRYGSDIYAQQIGSDGVPTSIAAPAPNVALRISDARPNPFSGVTSFDLDLPRASDVVVEVFDVAGRRLRREHFAQQQPGAHQFRFEARDVAGRSLPSGVYFYRVRANGETVTRKLVIAR